MKIFLYAFGDKTGSINIMCQDLKRAFEDLGHTAMVGYDEGTVLRDFAPDLLLCFTPRDFVTVQRQAGRWWHCGQFATVFSMSCETFNIPMMSGYLSTAMTSPMICHSQAIYDDLMERVRFIFAPARIREIMGNMWLINYGVGDHFQFTKKTDLDRWIAPLTRAVEDKRFDDHQTVTRCVNAVLSMRGKNPTTTFYAAGTELSKIHKTNMDGYIVKGMILDREKYAAELQNYAFAICTCHFESFGLYYIELLLSGIIVIFADYPWVRKLLPGYRFVASLEDLPSMAIHVSENYDASFAYIEAEVIPYIRENYMISQFAKKVLERIGPVQSSAVKEINAETLGS